MRKISVAGMVESQFDSFDYQIAVKKARKMSLEAQRDYLVSRYFEVGNKLASLGLSSKKVKEGTEEIIKEILNIEDHIDLL